MKDRSSIAVLIRTMEFPRTRPKPQRVKWVSAEQGETTGVRLWEDGGETEDFIPWTEFKSELERTLLLQLFANPSGFEFETRDHHGKKDWLVRVIDSSGNEFCDVWFGGDPDNGWGFDGLIRVGNALASEPPYVWQTYQRYSDGSYLRLPSRYGTLEKAKEKSR